MLGAASSEGLDDVAGEALEAIDVAPRSLPGAEVGGELVGGGGEGVEQQAGRGLGSGVLLKQRGRRVWPDPRGGSELFAPEDGERGRDGVSGPALVPFAEDGDLFGEAGLLGSVCRERVIGAVERRERLVEPGQIAVVGGGDE